MGYGILTVDFASIKDALFLPDDCQIVCVENTSTSKQYMELVIATPLIPDAPFAGNPVFGEKVPRLIAICKQEVPPEHECPDGFRCKKITTRLEVSQY